VDVIPSAAVVTYVAKSVFVSRTFWINTITLVVAVLSATDVVPIIPRAVVPFTTALVAAANIFLRTLAVRPVAWIAPAATAPILVARLPVQALPLEREP
jgi:hypothetical protein